ncbi:hypothetical protein AB0K18_07030 [Nonomuraea sp. NPDC049421]|uniref:hypothetical protein n=1 Tax=Nonomuraea sp. NPDC049421 TaxID=3155275 RepID=UPI003412F194
MAGGAGASSSISPLKKVTAYRCGLATSRSWRKGSARAVRDGSGTPSAADGMNWNL